MIDLKISHKIDLKISHKIDGTTVKVEFELPLEEARLAYTALVWERKAGLKDAIEDAITNYLFGKLDTPEDQEIYAKYCDEMDKKYRTGKYAENAK